MRIYLVLAVLGAMTGCSAATRSSDSSGVGGVPPLTPGEPMQPPGQTPGEGLPGDPLQPPPGMPPVVGEPDPTVGMPDTGCNKMDILFVIDNSGSMNEEQENLAANFPEFIRVLDLFNNGELDYRVGVTTTAFGQDLGFFGMLPAEDGELQRTPTMTRAWLERGDENLTEEFQAIATVGTNGSSQEQPLKAAQFALVDRAVPGGPNEGFHRDDALLAIVILTDEDDGSAGEGFFAPDLAVADFVTAFDTVAGDRGRWATAVIAGDTPGECESDFGSADYATRLIDFVNQTGDNAVMGSICSGDLSSELDKALSTFMLACDTFTLI